MEFVDPPEQVEVRVAEQALLRCEFKSSSLPVASCWIYNRDKVRMLDWLFFFNILSITLSYLYTSARLWLQAIFGGQRMSVRTTPNHSSVQIFHADPKDAGSYTVIVRNRAGSAQHTISLSVVGEINSWHECPQRDFGYWQLLENVKFLLRPTQSASIPACCFPAIHSVPGSVLVWPQLRRRHDNFGVHLGGL